MNLVSAFSLSWRIDEIPKPISDQYNGNYYMQFLSLVSFLATQGFVMVITLGFIYYNETPNNVPKTTTHKSKTKFFLRKNSTLTRPTASLLARQNKPLDMYSVRLLTR